MDNALFELIKIFAENPGAAFAGLEGVGGSKRLDPRSPDTFAKFVTFIEIAAYDFPPVAVETSFVDGHGDLGLDAIAVSLGDAVLFTNETPQVDNGAPAFSAEAADAAIAASPDAPIRVLLLQAKRRNPSGQHREDNDRVESGDLALFSHCTLRFLTRPWKEIVEPVQGQRAEPNKRYQRQWAAYNALRDAFRRAKKLFAPEVFLVFAYSGTWKEHEGPIDVQRTLLKDLQRELPDARNEVEVLGGEDLVRLADHAGPARKRTLMGLDVVPLPKAAAVDGYTGYVSVQSLMKEFSRTRDMWRRGQKVKVTELDERFFYDNVRFVLADNVRFNPGAMGLQETLKHGGGSRVILLHNGVTIVARNGSREGQKMTLFAPQIINGCQSCGKFREYEGSLENVFVPLKVVFTDDSDLIAAIIRASNTQALVDPYDLLACVSGVHSLQKEFEKGLSTAPDRLWLRRRRRGGLGEFVQNMDWHKALSPRNLMDGFAAVALGEPHTAHEEGRKLLDRVDQGEIFDMGVNGHEPTAYRAIGWHIVTGRKWADMPKRRSWDDLYERGRSTSYPARLQFVHALWHIVDDDPDHVDLKRGEAARRRFQTVIDRLVKDVNSGVPLGVMAGEAVENAAKAHGRALDYSLAGTAKFTERVRECASDMHREARKRKLV